MFQRIREARKSETGFTLIELLIVIIILGILAAVVVFAVSGISDRGKTSACKSNLNTANTAVEAYDAQKGNYPATFGDLVTGGFLHDDGTVQATSGTSVVYGSGTNQYTLTYSGAATHNVTASPAC